MTSNQENNARLAQVVVKVFQNKVEHSFEWAFTQDPEVFEKDIIEYNGRMRASGLEKFNGPSYAFVVTLYYSQYEYENKNACGALILYISEDIIERILKKMGHRDFDEDDQEFVVKECVEFCESIIGEVKKAMQPMGYREIVSSKPLGYKNEVLDGVLYPHDQNKFQEISFYLWNKKALVVDLVVAPAV